MKNTIERTFTLGTVALKDVSYRKEEYRHRFTLQDEALLASVKARGLIVPPMLLKTKNKYVIMAGFKRVACCRASGKKTIAALTISERALTPQEVFIIALESNRNSFLSDVDKSIAVSKALESFHFSKAIVQHTIAPLLGLAPSLKVINDYVTIAQLVEPLRMLIANNELNFKGALALASFLPVEQELIYKKILRQCFFSASELKVFCALLGGVLKRESTGLSELLKRKEVRAILQQSNASRRERGVKITQYLRERQYPFITKLNKELAYLKARLPFTKNIRLAAPVDFEADSFTLTITFNSAHELQNSVDCIYNNTQSLKRLFEIDKKLSF